MRWVWLVMLGACGRLGFDATSTGERLPDDAAGDSVTTCVAESDPELCARLGKTCEMVAATDNCGQPRDVDCGSCVAPATACLDNVCVAPICADASGDFTFATVGSPVASLHVASTQEALLGVSSNATTVLLLRGTGSPACVSGGSKLLIADDPSAMMSYTVRDISAVANLATFSKGEETMTLTADGLTIIGATSTGLFQSSSRSAVNQTDFGVPSPTEFAAINAGLPGGTTILWPVIAADGLSFSFTIVGATTVPDGIYESVRSSTAVPFPAATLLPGSVQGFIGISGRSSDGLTAFVTTSTFATEILSRTSLTDPFAAPTPAATPPGLAWRVVPLAGCTAVIGTCEPGGCWNEDVCIWNRQ